MADSNAYTDLEPGYYWVLPYGQDGALGEWQPMELDEDHYWHHIGSDEGFPWGWVRRVGPKLELTDSQVREAYDSVMADVEMKCTSTKVDFEAIEFRESLVFGPFTEWYHTDDAAVVVSWQNLIYHLEQREKLLAEANQS